MANYKRKRPKKITISDCGTRNCKYDSGSTYSMNGKDRYVVNQWKQFPYEGKNPWRYKNDIGQISY